YKLMKKEHPFITGSEDSIFAILLAFSDKKDEEIVADVEKIFKELKEDDIETNCKQTVALIFSLTEGDYLEKCNKLRDVLAELKRNDRKYSPYHEMGALAGLVLLPVDTHTMVQDMLEVDEFLSDKKDYGFLGFTKKERLSHAAMILSGYYSNNNNFTVEVGSLVSVIALIAVQEAALFGAIAAGVVVGAAH
ncbi:MAG: DUF4003 family protein, partial [Holdemanella sp.]|nr:DUF4003 family protein [Holdemanella sp.]